MCIASCPHRRMKLRVKVVNKAPGMHGFADLLGSYWIDFDVWAYIWIGIILANGQ